MNEHDLDREHAILAAVHYWRVLLERNEAPSVARDAEWPVDRDSLFTDALIKSAHARYPALTPEQIATFERHLIANVRADWRHVIDGTEISVDYSPCRTLGDALVAAAIRGGDLRLRYKTETYLASYEVQARSGYAAHRELIWQTKRGALIERVRAHEGFDWKVKRRAINYLEDCELPLDNDLDGAAFVVLTMARAQEELAEYDKRHA